MKKVATIILFLAASAVYCEEVIDGSWEIWIVPSKRILAPNEVLKLAVGITGYPALKPDNIKLVAYGESGVKLVNAGDPNAVAYDTMTMKPKSSNAELFSPINKEVPLMVVADVNPIGELLITPVNPGDGKVRFILTYSLDGKTGKTTEYEFEYHVNSLSEEHSTIFSILAIALGLIALPIFGNLGQWILRKLFGNQANARDSG